MDFGKKIIDVKRPDTPPSPVESVEDQELIEEEKDVQGIDADIHEIEGATSSQSQVEPTSSPVIASPQKKSHKVMNIALAVVLVLAVAGTSVYFFWMRPSVTNKPSVADQTSSAPVADAALQSDLNNVQSSLDQADSDQTSANSTMNDQQIAVPTE